MVLVLFSWLVMGAASFIFGKAVVDGIWRKDQSLSLIHISEPTRL